MIKKVTLYNFESHQNTTINFESNFNLIVGESNSGKSAIIRAMGVVVNNDWNKDMVRTGCEFCRVTVETDKGWVEAERGEKTNKWRCKENGQDIQYFKNVGTKVPELATKILGMGERDRGGDIKELPNFQFQLEKHYMLSEIGEKKATSNMIARMMDNAIGLGGMQDLIKDISTDLLKDKKWLTDKQGEIIELKSSILDEKIFNSYSKLIDDIDNKNQSIEKLNEDICIADKYNDKYNDIYNKRNNSKLILDSLPDFNKINILKEELSVLLKKIELCEKAYLLEKRVKSLKSIIDINTDKLNELKEYCIKHEKVIKLCEKALLYDNKIKQIKKIMNIDIENIKLKKENIENIINKINDAELKLNNARDIWKNKSSLSKEINIMIKDLELLNNDYEKLKDDLGVCPLCGKKFE